MKLKTIPIKASAAVGIAALAVFAGHSQAALTNTTLFDADFTAAPYVTGGLNNNGGTGIAAPGAYQVDTTSSVQTARNFSATILSAGFGRVYFPESLDLSAQSVVVGDMVTVTLAGLTILSDTNDDNILTLGLGINGGIGAGNPAIGTTLTRSGTDLLVNGQSTTVDIGDKFEFMFKMTAESAGAIAAQTFTVEGFVNGVSVSSGSNVSILAAGTGTDTYLQAILQDTDGNAETNARFTFEGITVATIAVPEPSVALLGALGMFGLVRRRR